MMSSFAEDIQIETGWAYAKDAAGNISVLCGRGANRDDVLSPFQH